MANTYSQIQLHIVFAVQYRQALLSKKWRKRLFMYINGIVENQGHKVLALNGVEDHIHILIGYRPTDPIPDLVRHIKGFSSKWINKMNLTPGVFRWQSGYGVFSVSTYAVPNVIDYIKNQEEHHKKKIFSEEYLEMLKEEEIEFDPKYTFSDLQ